MIYVFFCLYNTMFRLRAVTFRIKGESGFHFSNNRRRVLKLNDMYGGLS